MTRTTDTDGVSTIALDDGKVNALDVDVFRALDAAFDACADDAIVLAGRAGMFSPGMNPRLVPTLDRAGLTQLLVTFARTTHRIRLEPRPVVAAGTILAMACDHAIAAEGDYRWGLVEATIGFALPNWAMVLARGNIRADRLDDLARDTDELLV